MSALKIKQLNYYSQSDVLIQYLSRYPWPVLLDSCATDTQGRYDILSAKPYATLTTWGKRSLLCEVDQQRWSNDDPFVLIAALLAKAPPIEDASDDTIPFSGGAIGYFGYDLARRFERLPTQAKHDLQLPDAALGFYHWAIINDHQQQQTQLVYRCRTPDDEVFFTNLYADLQNINPKSSNFRLLKDFSPSSSKQQYLQSFQQIKKFLYEGDCYQVNLTQRFHAKGQGDACALHHMLRQRNPSPFTALLQTPYANILSYSPERFLQVRHNAVLAQPIKGTRPRSLDAAEDAKLASALSNSAKDRAENIMIVDLLRNDLSRNCEPGSVKVPELCQLQSFRHVHHLLSTITGTLAADNSCLDLLRDCFPGGSITGAPKIRAMEIIDSLESYRRNIYCGSIGYIGTDGNMDCNIAIRTLVWQADNLYCYAGGGIVADSAAEAEYKEMLDKIAWLL